MIGNCDFSNPEAVEAAMEKMKIPLLILFLSTLMASGSFYSSVYIPHLAKMSALDAEILKLQEMASYLNRTH